MGKEYELITSKTDGVVQFVLVYDWVGEELYFCIRRVSGHTTHICPAGKHRTAAEHIFDQFCSVMKEA